MKWLQKFRPALLTLTAAALLTLSLSGFTADVSADQSQSQTTVREVGSQSLKVYADRSLTGAAVTSYSRGNRITVTLNGDGSCTVFNDQGGQIGYCSPVDLVLPGDALFVQTPYLYSSDPQGHPLEFDLIDLDLYLSQNSSNVYKNVPEGGGEKTVLIARRMLGDLEDAAFDLAKIGVGLWVDAGYRPDGNKPAPDLPAYNTGCVLDIVLIRNNAELNISPDSDAFREVKILLQTHGFYLAPGSNYTFGYDDFEDCLGVNLDTAALPRIAAD